MQSHFQMTENLCKLLISIGKSFESLWNSLELYKCHVEVILQSVQVIWKSCTSQCMTVQFMSSVIHWAVFSVMLNPGMNYFYLELLKLWNFAPTVTSRVDGIPVNEAIFDKIFMALPLSLLTDPVVEQELLIEGVC